MLGVLYLINSIHVLCQCITDVSVFYTILSLLSLYALQEGGLNIRVCRAKALRVPQ